MGLAAAAVLLALLVAVARARVGPPARPPALWGGRVLVAPGPAPVLRRGTRWPASPTSARRTTPSHRSQDEAAHRADLTATLRMTRDSFRIGLVLTVIARPPAGLALGPGPGRPHRCRPHPTIAGPSPPPEDPRPHARSRRRVQRRAPAQRPAPDRRRGPPRARRGRQRLVQRRLQARGPRQDRLRAPVRARDVPGLGERRQGRAHGARAGGGRHAQRHHLAGPDQLLRDACPSHQLELALWLEADRMGTLLDALSQENLDNQRDVVKNEKRWSYDNRPYGTWIEKLLGHLYPDGHPYHHPTIGSMEDLDAASLDDVRDVLRDLLRAQQRGALGGGRLRARPGPRVGRTATSGRSRPTRPSRRCPTCRCPRVIGEERRETVEDRVPLPRVYFGVPGPGVRRPAARRPRPGDASSCPAARAAGSTGASSATSGSRRTS